MNPSASLPAGQSSSSCNRSKYITHIAHLCTAAILQQAGIERCPKSGMQILTDLLICFLRTLGNRLNRSMCLLTHRSCQHLELQDVIFLLEEQGFTAELLLGERQRMISTSSSTTTTNSETISNGSGGGGDGNISILNLLWGLPLRLDIEGKAVSSSHTAASSCQGKNDSMEEEFLYSFLPPFPTRKSSSSSLQSSASLREKSSEECILKAENALESQSSSSTYSTNSKGNKESVEENENSSCSLRQIPMEKPLLPWEWSQVPQIESSLLLKTAASEETSQITLPQFHKNNLSSKEQSFHSIPNEISDPPGRLAIGPLNKLKVGMQKLWRIPLWISGEMQVMQFLKEPTQPDSREAIIVLSASHSNSSSVVVAASTPQQNFDSEMMNNSENSNGCSSSSRLQIKITLGNSK